MNLVLHKNRIRCLAILNTMWGTAGDADAWFYISPHNHSGKRLYKITREEYYTLAVTNSCKEQTDHASKHGKPDPKWLSHNLNQLPDELRILPLLVCGSVAERTFDLVKDYAHLGPMFWMPHPAARTWSKKLITAHQNVYRVTVERWEEANAKGTNPVPKPQ